MEIKADKKLHWVLFCIAIVLFEPRPALIKRYTRETSRNTLLYHLYVHQAGALAGMLIIRGRDQILLQAFFPAQLVA